MADVMMGMPGEDLATENARLRKELSDLQSQREDEMAEIANKVEAERIASRSNVDLLQERSAELEAIKTRMVRLTRQLDEEVTRRDQIQAESSALERKVHEISKGAASATGGTITNPTMLSSSGKRLKERMMEEEEQAMRERGTQVSTKLMRVVDQWMRHKDLQQALLRNASINDSAFGTLTQALMDCPSLQTLDLSQNLLTMDSCSDICLLITTAPSLSFVSVAENLFSLRSVGYFMTSVMERQNTKKLMPLDLLDLQGNEGLLAAAAAPCPDSLLKQVQAFVGNLTKLPNKGAEVVAQVMRSLWRFLHDTQHPQVKELSPDEVAFHALDKATIRKMENALMKILLLSNDAGEGGSSSTLRPVTANFAFSSLLEEPHGDESTPREGVSAGSVGTGGLGNTGGRGGKVQDEMTHTLSTNGKRGLDREKSGDVQASPSNGGRRRSQEQRPRQIADPFADLKTAFEPPRDKLKTFNLKQIVTRNGTVLMNMLERLLEVTEIDAHDVETDQTLLEFACNTGNMGLAKLCYRRGANLSAKTRKGDTAFNIVTRNKRYDMMEFLHTYGVKVNSCDAEGATALHVAAAGDDVDAICRLLEWGADVNARDNKKRTPIHIAAGGGNAKSMMLLLEVGADMNAKDEREYTAVAHAEAKNHFALMDRLVQLGGRGHGLQTKSKDLDRSRSAKQIGELIVSAGMLKSSSLGRIGKVAVKGMAGPLSPSVVTK